MLASSGRPRITHQTSDAFGQTLDITRGLASVGVSSDLDVPRCRNERRVLIDLTALGKALRAEAETVPAMLVAGLDFGEGEVVELRDRVRAQVAALTT